MVVSDRPGHHESGWWGWTTNRPDGRSGTVHRSVRRLQQLVGCGAGRSPGAPGWWTTRSPHRAALPVVVTRFCQASGAVWTCGSGGASVHHRRPVARRTRTPIPFPLPTHRSPVWSWPCACSPRTSERGSPTGAGPPSRRHRPGRVPPQSIPEARCEAHLSAQQPPSIPQARLPRPDADQRWPSRRQQPSPPRPGEAVGMNPVAGGHERLRRGADITRVMRGRQQRAGRLLVTHVAPSPAAGGSARVAVVASRRVGNAVARNRCKRLLREAARHCTIREGLDVVLVARAAMTGSSAPAVHRELRAHLEQLDAAPSRAATG